MKKLFLTFWFCLFAMSCTAATLPKFSGQFYGDGTGLSNLFTTNLVAVYDRVDTNALWVTGGAADGNPGADGKYSWTASQHSYVNANLWGIYRDAVTIFPSVQLSATNASGTIMYDDCGLGGINAAFAYDTPALATANEQWGAAGTCNSDNPIITVWGTNHVGPIDAPLLLDNSINLTNFNPVALSNSLYNHGLWLSPTILSNYQDELPQALLVHGGMQINSVTNYVARGNKAETFAAIFGQYAPENTGQNMALFMGPANYWWNTSQSSTAPHVRHTSYILGASLNNSLLNMDYMKWFEWDVGDNAQMILWGNGGVSIDGSISPAGAYGGSGNHPNFTGSANQWNTGPGTNSLSVRSNIYSRFGVITSTNGFVFGQTTLSAFWTNQIPVSDATHTNWWLGSTNGIPILVATNFNNTPAGQAFFVKVLVP